MLISVFKENYDNTVLGRKFNITLYQYKNPLLSVPKENPLLFCLEKSLKIDFYFPYIFTFKTHVIIG